MDEKEKIKIIRHRCRCSGCIENGWIYYDDGPDQDGEPMWCEAIAINGNYDLWETVVKAIQADPKYDIVYDDSGIK